MFRKPIKIKSNNQVKGSERKTIKEKFLQAFPNLTEALIDDLFPKKDVLSSVKLTTATNEIVHVYTIQKCPMAFDVRGTLIPTVFLLWKFPDLLHAFTTHQQVMGFLKSGADLMLPGVITPPVASNLSKYGTLNEGAIACANLSDNKAAIAVGYTAQSSMEMSGGKGKCLSIIHLYGDKLCSLEESCPPIAKLGPPEWLQFSSYDQDFPELGSSKDSNNTCTERASTTAELISEETVIEESQEIQELDVVCAVDEMDELLNYCFLVAIKYSKTLTLPILTSNFYKLQMLTACPEGKTLDIKKTSFKKLKTFLDSVCKEGLITIKEIKKGVESITGINKEHAKFAEFYIEPSLRPRKDEKETTETSTSVTESYIITPNVVPIFADRGLCKGDTVQLSQIRQCVTDYAKKAGCVNEDNKKLVKPKNALTKVCKTENYITWEELIEKVCEAMKNCYKVSSGNEELVNKGKVSPITITVSQRSGNKKVTLIDNLELFGIKIGDFAKECQHGVAASTSTSRPEGKKCDQLLVQGNQVLFVHKLLTEKYKIPLKYIRGLENAPKKKK